MSLRTKPERTKTLEPSVPGAPVQASAARHPRGRLIAVTDGREQIFELSQSATIGRDSDNDIVLTDITVSRVHAVLVSQPEGLFLMDLGSANGTYINGVLAPADEALPLADGDLIQLGRALLRYRVA